MLKRIEGVLLTLNETEREALDRLLTVASKHIAEVGRLSKDEGRYFSKETSQAMVRAVIDGLREELDLREVEPAPVDVEQWRRELALKRDDHFVSSRRVLCSYDRCSETFEKRPGMKGHVWDEALKAGWKVLDHEHHKPGEYSETIGYPSADLICALKHDKHGCGLYDGDEQYCRYWPNTDYNI